MSQSGDSSLKESLLLEPSPGVNQLKGVHTVIKASGPRVALGEHFDPYVLHSLEQVTAPPQESVLLQFAGCGSGTICGSPMG